MQGSFEGGFMGRTNKLVDGCYSFWQVMSALSIAAPGPVHRLCSPSPAGLTRSLQGSPTAQLRQAQGLQSSLRQPCRACLPQVLTHAALAGCWLWRRSH